MQVYNSLTKQTEIFRPASDIVTLYTCGPTVYNYAHIGNLRTFVFEDLLKRWLGVSGFKVKHVKNLTDIDDKIIKAAQEHKISRAELTEKYAEAFLDDLETLSIKKADVYPKATDHVAEMISLIQTLIDKGVAYSVSSGVYYRVAHAKNLSLLAAPESLEVGASGRGNLEDLDKENPEDFALWKSHTAKDGDAFWESPWGKGRPGWHIECSAMSVKHLSDAFSGGTFKTIDIHTGGVDLTFPHHQSEIMQSESCFETQFVKYWMHSEHLMVDGQKMSKTLGNFYTLRDLTAKGFHPLVLRYLLLSVHYRQPLNFTLEALEGAGQAVQRLNDFYNRLSELETNSEESDDIASATWRLEQEFKFHLDNDLHVPKALGVLFDFVTYLNTQTSKGLIGKETLKEVIRVLNAIDSILKFVLPKATLDQELVELLDARVSARSSKDWKKSDTLRLLLKDRGIVVEDTPRGQRWKKLTNG